MERFRRPTDDLREYFARRKFTISLFSVAFVSVFFYIIHPLFPYLFGEQESEKGKYWPSGDVFQEELALRFPDYPDHPELTYEPTFEYTPSAPAPLLPGVDEEGLPRWEQDLVAKLQFLQSPLPGAGITTRNSQLPGAPRAYRNGTHEGLDYYNGFCGIQIRFGDPVYAAAEGIIIRIDHEYSEPDAAARRELLAVAHSRPETPQDILDVLRGRQVWIEHKKGIITRYAHLQDVAEHLQEGSLVEAGEFIGTIGNSGTSDGARGNTLNAHLHFEIWLGDYFLGQGLTPSKMRKLWQEVLL